MSCEQSARTDIEFRRLTDVSTADIVELMNQPSLRQFMPLLQEGFCDADCAAFVLAKESLWHDHGYGPWGFYVGGQFAGWGGLQPENGEPDLAIVLHPRFWGLGRRLFEEIIGRAFGEMGFETVTALLPPSRTRVKGMTRLGFYRDGELEINGEMFVRFRLDSSPR